MSSRGISPGVAALTLGFPVAAFLLGAVWLPAFDFLLLAIIALGGWAMLRQRELGELTLLHRAVRSLIAYAVIGLVLLIAFELGQFLEVTIELSSN